MNDFKAWYDLLERLQMDKDSLLVPSVTSCSARDVMVGAQNKEGFASTTWIIDVMLQCLGTQKCFR